MNYDTIRYEVADGIATVTMNRPEVFNAMSPQQLEELVDVFDQSDRDDDVRAVVVTGAGKAFCSGADLSKGAGAVFGMAARKTKGDYSAEASRDGGGRLALRIYGSLKPVIGAVNGAAVGVGASMLLPMDIRVASEKARVGFVYARRGIAFECCSSYFLPRIVGISRALEWSYSGRVMSAPELKEGGLFRDVVAPEQLLPAAYAIAREIADHTAPVSIALMRHMLWQGQAMRHPMEAHKVESRAIGSRGQATDAKEGVQSFIEKRLPKFACTVSKDMPDFFPWWQEPKYSDPL